MSPETKTLLNAANLLDKEAETWAEGFAGRKDDGTLYWEKTYEWAHVRYFKLSSSAKQLRALAARFAQKSSRR